MNVGAIMESDARSTGVQLKTCLLLMQKNKFNFATLTVQSLESTVSSVGRAPTLDRKVAGPIITRGAVLCP